MNCIRDIEDELVMKMSPAAFMREKLAGAQRALVKAETWEQARLARQMHQFSAYLPEVGEMGALDLVASLGMWLNENGIEDLNEIRRN